MFYFLLSQHFPLPIGFFLYGQTILTGKEQRREHFQHRPFSAKSTSVGTGETAWRKLHFEVNMRAFQQ